MIYLYLMDGTFLTFLPVLWPHGKEYYALADLLYPDDEVEFQSFNPEVN